MAQTLSGKTVAVLATDGVELVELTEPVKALKEAGASVEILSLKAGEFQGFNHLTPGDKVTADKAVADADAGSYAGLLLPGGVANPDQLRADKDALPMLDDLRECVDECSTCWKSEDTHLTALADELRALIASTQYKLKFLK